MKIRAVITILSLLAVFIGVSASKLTKQIGKVTDGYNFWLYTPDGATTAKNDTTSKKPVFIFLHGASLCGNNIDKVRGYGTIDAIEKGRQIDGFVIAPQNPGGAWSPKKIMNVLDWVENNYNVDKNRVYVLGMSLGGYGTIDLAASYPERITAALAMCGGGSVGNLGRLKDVPLWIIHGTADTAVRVSESDKVVNAIKTASGGKTPRLAYDRVPGMNHSQPARMFYMPQTYDWLLKHSLSDPSRPIAKTFSVSNGALQSAYDGLKFSKGSSSSKKTYSNTKKKSSKKSTRRRHSRRSRK